jgi:hypothetical protein
MVSESVDAAFGMLAQTEQPHGGRTVEELVTELIRPTLKTWLDDNLPGLVERLVRGSASWLLVTAMRDADHMAEQWGHDVAITRLAYMKRHLERNREAEIESAARAKGLAAEQQDKVTLLRDPPAEPPRDLNPQEAEIWQATVDGMKAQGLLRDFDEFCAQVNKLETERATDIKEHQLALASFRAACKRLAGSIALRQGRIHDRGQPPSAPSVA